MSNKLDSRVIEARRTLVGDRDMFSVSELFHENSKIIPAAPRFSISAEVASISTLGTKRYQHACSISLPLLRSDISSALFNTIVSRRSCRNFDGTPITIADLSDIVFLANGAANHTHQRSIPSAGGLYPIELYCATIRILDLPVGLFHYNVKEHALVALNDDDPLSSIRESIFVPEALAGSAVVIVLTSVFGRSKIKYGERAYRFALLEAGHCMQNICLAATALRLAVCPIGGFLDDKLNDFIDIDGVEEAVLYACIIGKPAA
jgi:SagB-type dehydrogenase family enzyme